MNTATAMPTTTPIIPVSFANEQFGAELIAESFDRRYALVQAIFNTTGEYHFFITKWENGQDVVIYYAENDIENIITVWAEFEPSGFQPEMTDEQIIINWLSA